jgi:hypothetical protein
MWEILIHVAASAGRIAKLNALAHLTLLLEIQHLVEKGAKVNLDHVEFTLKDWDAWRKVIHYVLADVVGFSGSPRMRSVLSIFASSTDPWRRVGSLSPSQTITATRATLREELSFRR